MAMNFKRLRTKLFEEEITQEYLASKIKKSTTYISKRMNALGSFTLNDVYGICELAHIPYEEIHLYFPKEG